MVFIGTKYHKENGEVVGEILTDPVIVRVDTDPRTQTMNTMAMCLVMSEEKGIQCINVTGAKLSQFLMPDIFEE